MYDSTVDTRPKRFSAGVLLVKNSAWLLEGVPPFFCLAYGIGVEDIMVEAIMGTAFPAVNSSGSRMRQSHLGSHLPSISCV